MPHSRHCCEVWRQSIKRETSSSCYWYLSLHKIWKWLKTMKARHPTDRQTDKHTEPITYTLQGENETWHTSILVSVWARSTGLLSHQFPLSFLSNTRPVLTDGLHPWVWFCRRSLSVKWKLFSFALHWDSVYTIPGSFSYIIKHHKVLRKAAL